MKKKISVVIPTYNEEANVVPLAKAVSEVMERDLSEYDYEILFIDNHSKDNTQALLRGLCANNKKIKAIFNAKNFGQARSPVYGMKQAYGDCVVRMCADFQDPVDMIPKFVREWEQGTKIVIGVKSASKERKGMYWIRSCYYKVINKITDIDHIEQFTGFGLYDKKFVDVVRDLHDPLPYLRGIIAELGFETDRAGRVVVNENLQVNGHPDIFAIGDCANFQHGTERPLPTVAPVATQQAVVCFENVKKLMRGQTDLAAFTYKDLGAMATIGRGDAVMCKGGMKMKGFFAWSAWLIVHLMRLAGAHTNITVSLKWMWNFLSGTRLGRIITNIELN